MKTDLFYFSGTGNSLFIAKTIKEQLEIDTNEKVSIQPMTKFNINEKITSNANRVGLIYPTYDMDAPSIVKEFAKSLNVNKDAYVFVYPSSGGVAGVSASSIKKILNNNGIEVSNAFHGVYPDNSTVFKPIDKNEISTQIETLKSLHIKDSLDIKNEVKNLDNPLLKSKFLTSIAVRGADLVFKNVIGFKDIRVNEDTCIGCGVCEKICPMKNISIKDNLPKFDKKCEMCVGCISACPKKALRYKRLKEANNTQYRHPYISLEEMFID